MTQSAQPKKQPEPLAKKEEAPKSKMDELIDRLKEEKPAVYEQYVTAARNKRPVWIYPDMTVRIG